MATCQHCLQKMCRRHPLQDHGARMNQLQEKAKNSSKASFDELIQAQINKFRAENVSTTIDDVYEYRSKLDAERKSAVTSKVPVAKKGFDQIVSAGLNPAVASIMLQEDDDDEFSERSDRNSGKKRKRKRDEDKERKRSKKEKKSKKHRKEKKSKKKRKHDYDSDTSSSSSSSSNSSSSRH